MTDIFKKSESKLRTRFSDEYKINIPSRNMNM